MSTPDRAESYGTDDRADQLDRNWAELLQELRVAQTGVQILTAFLLTVPFAPRFEELDDTDRQVFGGVLTCALLATIFLMAPVAMHRQLFRQRRRPWLVDTAHRLAQLGMALLAISNVGAAWIVLDFIISATVAYVAASFLAATAVVLWILLPAWERRRDSA